MSLLARSATHPGPRTTTTKRPPGPSTRLGRGLLAARRDPVDFLLRVARQYGDVAYVKAGPFDIYLLSHPDHIRDVLVTHGRSFMKGQGLQEAKRLLGEGLLTSEGDFHRRQRRLIQPLFGHDRIAGYGAVMAEYASRTSDRWQDGQTLDMHGEMTGLTLAIVGKTLFGADLEEADARRVADALTAALGLFDRLTLPYASLMEHLPLAVNRQFGAAKATLDGIIHGLIHERRAAGVGDGGDVLSMLLAAQDEESTEGMTDLQVRDEAITILLAGHETTANALTWTLYLLSQHPDVEARMHMEIDEVLEGRLPTVDHTPALSYTEMVLAESMRLYPPAWILGRRALEDQAIADYVIPAGSIAVTSQYIVHHDRRWYPDPQRFDPDRWLPEAAARRPKLSYFPFGAGSRVCIGESFAWLEGVLVLATIAQRWRARLVPGHPVDLLPRVTLRPKHGMRMTVHRR